MVVRAVPPPPPASEARWWARAAGARRRGHRRRDRGRGSGAEPADLDRSPAAVRVSTGLLGSPPMTEVASVLFGREDVRRRVEELGRAITGDYAGREPVLITVLKGGSGVPRGPDARGRPSRSRSTSSRSAATATPRSRSGACRILLDLDVDLTGRDVMLVEDIVDTGLTLPYLLSVLRARGPASIEVCALLDKSVRRIAPLSPRYVGFDCPDRFVVGLRAGLRRAIPQPSRHLGGRRPRRAPGRPRRARPAGSPRRER